MPRRIAMFQWGYEGWGNATRLLVRNIDAVEAMHGFDPPIFVDIRMSRSVRAVGFRDHAFEKLLGHKRYRWMRSLGNEAIRTGSRKMKIQCPDAAHQLLDLAIDAAETNRRVIYFCSCPSPQAARDCHRAKVSKLLLRAARSRGVRLDVQEWPGGSNAREPLTLRVTSAELKRLRRRAPSVNVSPRQVTAEVFGLPHGSLVELIAPGDRQLVSVYTPMYRAKRWSLPLFVTYADEGDTRALLSRYGKRFRGQDNLGPMKAG